jgi:hypothetical protein
MHCEYNCPCAEVPIRDRVEANRVAQDLCHSTPCRVSRLFIDPQDDWARARAAARIAARRRGRTRRVRDCRGALLARTMVDLLFASRVMIHG